MNISHREKKKDWRDFEKIFLSCKKKKKKPEKKFVVFAWKPDKSFFFLSRSQSFQEVSCTNFPLCQRRWNKIKMVFVFFFSSLRTRVLFYFLLARLPFWLRVSECSFNLPPSPCMDSLAAGAEIWGVLWVKWHPENWGSLKSSKRDAWLFTFCVRMPIGAVLNLQAFI